MARDPASVLGPNPTRARREPPPAPDPVKTGALGVAAGMVAQADQAARLRRGPGVPGLAGPVETGEPLDSPAQLPRYASGTRSASSAPEPGETAGDPDGGARAATSSTGAGGRSGRSQEFADVPRISTFWNAALNGGKGGWGWVKIRTHWLERSLREGKPVPFDGIARDMGVHPRNLTERARLEKWKDQYRYRKTQEHGALPVETGEDFRTRLLRSKEANLLMLETLERKLDALMKGEKTSMAKIRSAVAITQMMVEIRREEARQPEHRSRKEIAFKGLLVPAPYAEPGMDGQFILDQMPGSSPLPSAQKTRPPAPSGGASAAKPAPRTSGAARSGSAATAAGRGGAGKPRSSAGGSEPAKKAAR